VLSQAPCALFRRLKKRPRPGRPERGVVSCRFRGAYFAAAGGAETGVFSPRWQVKQVTCTFPSGKALLTFWTMANIMRAVTFISLPSLERSASWQSLHVTPRPATASFIRGRKVSGVKTFRFLGGPPLPAGAWAHKAAAKITNSMVNWRIENSILHDILRNLKDLLHLSPPGHSSQFLSGIRYNG